MALIYLYILSSISVLIDIAPLTIAVIFFCICYLPGLTLLAFIKKDRLEIEELILAFPGSIGISSLLTLGLLYIGIHVKFIAYLIHGITGFIILFYFIKYRKLPNLQIHLSTAEVKFISIAFFATLIFSLPVISERIAISAHGFHHLSILTRIFSGIFPPENPGLAGTSISYHWGYHALVAAISFSSDFHPLRVFSALNVISLFFILCISYRSAKSFGLSEGYRYLVPLTIIGLMRSDAGFFLFQKLISGNFPPVQNISSAPQDLLTSWVWGVSYLDTRLFFMNKFYNANSMPLGICLIFVFFLICLLFLEENKKRIYKKMLMIFLFLVLIAVAITYSFFLIIPLVFVPIWSGMLFWKTPGSLREKAQDGLYLIVPCILAAIITAPYLYAITAGESVLTTGKSRYIYWDEQVIRNLIVFMLPSPLIIAGFWFAFKQFAFSKKMIFLLSGTVMCLLLSIFLRFRWYNEDKFSFILSFFISFPFVFSFLYLLSLFSNQRLKNAIVVCLVVFLLSTPVITEAAYLLCPWFKDNTFAFSGRNVIFAKDKSRNEAYMWLRDNTPLNAILMLPYVITPYWDRTANFISYRPVALSERSLFVIKDVYAFISKEYDKRVNIRKQLFENPTNSQVKKYLSSLNRPVYLLIEEGYEDPLLEGAEFDQVPEKSDEVFLLVFQNDRQRVYEIQYDKKVE